MFAYVEIEEAYQCIMDRKYAGINANFLSLLWNFQLPFLQQYPLINQLFDFCGLLKF